MRRIVGAAIVAGVVAGAAGAAVQAQEGPSPAAPAAAVPAQAASIPISTREEGRLPDGRFSASYVHYRVHRPRVTVIAPDPAGGPEWAVKVFDAERITLKRLARTLAGGRVVGAIAACSSAGSRTACSAGSTATAASAARGPRRSTG